MARRHFKRLMGFGPWLHGQALVEAIKKFDVESYNRLRRDNPQWRPNFGGGDLRDMDLTLVNLRQASLVGAQVDGVIINGLTLEGERALASLERQGAVVR